MVRGLDTASKHKRKKIDLRKDLMVNKRAVESYCNRAGTRTEQEMEKSPKKKK